MSHDGASPGLGVGLVLLGRKERVSPGRPDAPPTPHQARAAICLFYSQALAGVPLSFLAHTHICESIYTTLTRSLFDDRSENA